MREARLGTFEELVAESDPNVRAVATAVRAVVYAVHPAATEVVRLGDRAATYGLGPRKMIEGYAYVMPQPDYVNLGFFKGTRLPDPDGVLEGTGLTMRHVKVRRVAEAASPSIRALLEAAVQERREALGRR